MGVRADQAVNNHKSFNTCSGSVLMAFADKIGISKNGAKGSVMCSDLRGNCRACVTDAARILEDMIG